MQLAAILVAAGTGSRFGAGMPKQFLTLLGEPVIRHAARALIEAGAILQPVGDAGAIDEALHGLPRLPTVAGGATRQDSVRCGLLALRPHAPEFVLVHDAARPVIPARTVPDLLAALAHAPGAIPAAPVADTLKRVRDGMIVETVPRDGLFRAQTPQAFRFDALLAAHQSGAHQSGAHQSGTHQSGAHQSGTHQSGMTGATDDASLLEALGQKVAIVTGSEANIKLTYPDDLARLEAVMSMHTPLFPHIGTGFDVHALASDRPMVLCGVTVPHDKGLAGHSDADVGIHALCDAIYGALAEGDIGRHFPPGEAAWKDADSARFLAHAAGRIAARGGRLVNADVTLICERPKISPHAQAMRERLAGLLRVDAGCISVKATTTERLGFTGRGEGIAAQAAVVVLLPAKMATDS
jgi:2-C-methyl-D-erythritol 4-phosphate cytidylyltransferase/2-C-methyl-D-erythritol 2,4-cyclodiphosphate synthase